MSQASQPGQTSQPVGLFSDKDMPALFQQADQTSIRSQARFLTWLRAELVLLSLAAAIALLNSFLPSVGPLSIVGFTNLNLPVADLASGLFILIALIIRLARYATHPDTTWYEARAAAESAKSIAWRYAVGGRPFAIGVKDEALVEKLVNQRLAETLTDVATDSKTIRFTDNGQITPAMRNLRQQPLAIRQEAYRAQRIADQEKWYRRKAQWNHDRGLFWHGIMITLEVLGVVAALAQAIHILPFNAQSLIAAIVGGIISWTQTRRFQDLYASYRVTANELATIAQSIVTQNTETQWSAFVNEAEEACSREHRLWRATRDEHDASQAG